MLSRRLLMTGLPENKDDVPYEAIVFTSVKETRAAAICKVQQLCLM